MEKDESENWFNPLVNLMVFKLWRQDMKIKIDSMR